MKPTTATWVAVLHLLRPQGRRGELLAEPLTDQTDLLTPGRELWLAAQGSVEPPDGIAPLRLEEAWQPTGRNAGRWVLKLNAANSISEAEALEGKDLLIPEAELPALEDDTWFVRDLVGCRLYDGPTLAGTVVGVEYLTGSDGRRLEDSAPLLAVELATDASSAEGEASVSDPEAEPVLVPFLRAWLDSVDLDAGRIEMHLPEGLLQDVS